MDAPQRLALDEAMQALDAEGELPERQRALLAQAPLAQPGKVLGSGTVTWKTHG